MGAPITPLSSISLSSIDEPQHGIADLDLPSPASEDIALTTPSIDHAIGLDAEAQLPWTTPSTQPILAAPGPISTAFDQTITPLQEYPPVVPLDAIVGAAIDPTPSHEPSLPTPSVSYPRSHGLRLPSFDALGIANPRPCDFRNRIFPKASSTSLGSGANVDILQEVGDLPTVDNTLHLDHVGDEPNQGLPDTASRAHAKVALQQFVTTLTPPTEQGGPMWESFATRGAGPIDTPTTDTGSAARTPNTAEPALSTTAVEPPSLGAPRIQVQRTDSDSQRSSWLDEATEATISALQISRHHQGPIKVLSHALPCPSTTGFAFPKIISALHNDTPEANTHWINVFHALHGRYNLADLPTSPPGTPGPAIGGDDYFTTKVFDSAVPVLDYQENLTTLPKTPRPVVPPSSINVSIVERYIPPTRQSEFAEMFDLKGRSILVDRMVEISPDHGTMLFIYPTKRGAQTFTRDYLSPVLDPLLRSMCIINGLSVDLGSAIGTMKAADKMLSFDTLTRKIRQLCHDLSQEGHHVSRMSGRQASFSLRFASKEEVMLERQVWAENWWVKQEKPRVREELSKYFRMARKLPVDSDVTPTNLIHEVLDGVTSRPYAVGDEPSQGVEVGIFVIQRTS